MNEGKTKSMATRSSKRSTQIQGNLCWKKIGEIGLGQAYLVEMGPYKYRDVLFGITDLSTGEIYTLDRDEEGDTKRVGRQN